MDLNSATPNLNQVVANTAPILAPFWNNNTFTPGIGRNLRTKLVGTAPNRCFVFEWRLITNSSYYGAGDMTFQMRLYETSGIVEYVYGNMAITPGSVSAIVNQAAIGFTVNSNLNNNCYWQARRFQQAASSRWYFWVPKSRRKHSRLH